VSLLNGSDYSRAVNCGAKSHSLPPLLVARLVQVSGILGFNIDTNDRC
jgi:hypothetical protein